MDTTSPQVKARIWCKSEFTGFITHGEWSTRPMQKHIQVLQHTVHGFSHKLQIYGEPEPFQNRKEGCTTRAMDLASANGHLYVVRYLKENCLQ